MTKGLPELPPPYLPAPYAKADVQAVQALFTGTANDIQQARVVAWIVNAAAATYDQSYRGGGKAEDTAFAEGRRFVGNQLIKLSKLNIGNMKDD